MKTTFFTAAAALSFGVGSAYADSSALGANTMFTALPGVLAQAPHSPAVVPPSNGQAMQGYVTQSSRGTWLFPPNSSGGANS